MKLTAFLILFSFISLLAVSQNTKLIEIKFPLSEQVKSRYYVLESDTSIKDGPYFRYYRSINDQIFTEIKGQYIENRKSGIWYWYSEQGEVTLTYDYDSSKFVHGNLKVISNIHYPEEAILNNIEGIVTVEFTIDSDCNITNINILKGLGYGCDEEVKRSLIYLFEQNKNKGYPCETKTEKVDITFEIDP